MPITPTVHTFDPQVVGKIGLSIDLPPSYDQVIWFASHSPSSGFVQVAVEYNVPALGLDGLSRISDAAPGSTLYFQAKLHDPATGYGAMSAPVAATVSAGPPPPPAPPTPEEQVNAALGITLQAGDVIEVFPATPTTSMTVNADGSIS